MKKTKTAPKKKVAKNRLLCVTLSEALLKSSKKYRRTVGFSSMSELLRATANHRSASVLKKNVVEPKKQISFRLSDELYSELSRVADRTGQSIARIIRTLLENAPKLGIRPEGVSPAKTAVRVPATKKPALPAKGKQSPKTGAGKKKSLPASGKKSAKNAPKGKLVSAKPVAKKQPSSATKKTARSRKKK